MVAASYDKPWRVDTFYCHTLISLKCHLLARLDLGWVPHQAVTVSLASTPASEYRELPFVLTRVTQQGNGLCSAKQAMLCLSLRSIGNAHLRGTPSDVLCSCLSYIARLEEGWRLGASTEIS